MLTIALAKGRIEKKVMEILCSKYPLDLNNYKNSRKLILKTDYFNLILVKACDVPIYVDTGIADLGIVGRDTILESSLDLYELRYLSFGKCRMSLAAKNNQIMDNPPSILRVATKYPKISSKYLNEKKLSFRLIPLMGSVELAPLVDLSDVIIDIVETGNTLKANNLYEIDSFLEITSSVVSNHSSYKFKKAEINNFLEQIV